MRDSTMKATPHEQKQVEKDYGPMKHVGEDTFEAPTEKAGERGWDGNHTSKERTVRVPDKIIPHGVVE